MAVTSQFFVGISLAANITGEQALLLRYSLKNEREKNLGMFRAANGVGGLMTPIIGSAMFAWSGFMGAFMYVGIGYLLITPFIYYALYSSRDLFLAEAKKFKDELKEAE